MNQSRQIQLNVEYFNTFIEKVSVNHPNQDMLLKKMSQLRNNILMNQDNLDNYFDFLKNIYNPANNHRDVSPGKAPVNENKTGRDNTPTQNQPEQPRGRNQSTYNTAPGDNSNKNYNMNNNNNNSNNNNNNNINSNSTNINATVPVYKDSNSYFQTEPEQFPEFDPSMLNDTKGFQMIKFSEFPGFRIGQQLYQIGSKNGINLNNKFKSIREFVSDANSFYRNISFRYMQNIFQEQKQVHLAEMLQLVQIRRIELRSPFPMDQSSQENLRKKFCGFIKHLQVISEQNVNPTYPIETLYQMVNGDNIFDLSLISFIQQFAIQYLRELDPGLFKYLMQQNSSDVENLNDIINQIRASTEPNDITLKIISATLDLPIIIQSIETNGVLVEKKLRLVNPLSNQNQMGVIQYNSSFNFLCFQNSYVSIYYALYPYPITSSSPSLNKNNFNINNNFDLGDEKQRGNEGVYIQSSPLVLSPLNVAQSNQPNTEIQDFLKQTNNQPYGNNQQKISPTLQNQKNDGYDQFLKSKSYFPESVKNKI